MPYTYRDATEADLPQIVEIYNFAVASRKPRFSVVSGALVTKLSARLHSLCVRKALACYRAFLLPVWFAGPHHGRLRQRWASHAHHISCFAEPS